MEDKDCHFDVLNCLVDIAKLKTILEVNVSTSCGYTWYCHVRLLLEIILELVICLESMGKPELMELYKTPDLLEDIERRDFE